MSSTEKIIKGAGIVLAICIIMGIGSFIVTLVSSILWMADSKHLENVSYDIKNDINNLEIETIAKLKICVGEEFKVVTNNRYVKVREGNGLLEIRESSHFKFINRNDYYVTLYVPDKYVFENVVIENAAGIIDFEYLQTENLDLDIGAGLSKIDDLRVLRKANIETGAGKLDIGDGTINNLDLDIGAGSVYIKSSIFGNSDIVVGVGKLQLELKEGMDKYSFKVEKGIGDVRINSKKMSNNERYGEGDSLVKVSNGIGSIDIYTMGE